MARFEAAPAPLPSTEFETVEGFDVNDSYERALAKKGVKVIESGKTFSGKMDLLTLEAAVPFDALRRIQSLSESFVEYLSYDITQDNFLNHNKRRAWLVKMKDTFGSQAERLRLNRLRINAIVRFFYQLTKLHTQLNELPSSPVVDELRAAVRKIVTPMQPLDSFGKRYASYISARKKIRIVRAISAGMRHFLEVIENPNRL